MALRSAVAPLLIVILAWPVPSARATTAVAPPVTREADPLEVGTPPVSTPPRGTVGTTVGAPVADPDPNDAEALYNAGEQAYWLGDFRRATQLFEAAYARSGLPALLYNVGLATMRRYELTQDPEDLRRARAVLTNYAQELAKDPTLQQADNVPRLIAQLDATLASLAAPKPAAPKPAAKPSEPPPVDPQDRCEPTPVIDRSGATRRAGASIMTFGGLALAGGVATTVAFALKGQSFQQQQDKLLADAAARDCSGAASQSAACIALADSVAITVRNGQRANLLAGGLGGGLMALGVAGLVVGAVVFSRAPRQRGKLAISPALTPQAAGLILSGRF
ncbi:hypothetical protein [Nannocystis sp.]|uniref:hypothetical protein n=1 Tax=Nannocystis sp. TaxID=1962667 RepID=UPI0025FD4DDE|nr:hypothetical protein [Nannocystis sp.]MBK7824254.1 hypothetical protein [Nannocystis sp.]